MRVSRFAMLPLFLSFLYVLYAAAFTPSTNSKGIKWVSQSAESWSGNAQTNGLGATLHLAGAFDQSVDTMNHIGVTAHLGLLDPISTTACTPEFDLTGDSKINAADLLLLLKDVSVGNLRSDLNCDGQTDHLDMYRWSQEWRSTTP